MAVPDPSGSILALAGEIEGTSPGFAARVRDAAATMSGLPAELQEGFAATMGALIRVEGPGRDASQALIALEPGDVGRLGAAGLQALAEAATAIGAVSVRAASAFLAGCLVRPLDLASLEGLPRASAALEDLARRRGREPAVQRFASAAGRSLRVSGGATIEAWAELVDRMGFGGRRHGEILRDLPQIPSLDDAAYAGALRAACRAARTSQGAAAEAFQNAPSQVARVPVPYRAAAVELLCAVAASGEALADALGMLGPVVGRCPEDERAQVLELGLRVAEAGPRAAARFLRKVLRVSEAVGFGEGLEAFVTKGLELAETNRAAAEAFFALETRGAQNFLRSRETAVLLEEVETTLRGYLHLISGQRLAVVGLEARGLFCPIDPRQELPIVAERVDAFPRWEDNFTLLKLQATIASILPEVGTREFELGRWLEEPEREGSLTEFYHAFESPEIAAGMFAHLEAVRLAPVLGARFPGLYADLAPLRRRLFRDDRVATENGAPGTILYLALGGHADDLEIEEGWADSLRAFAHRAATGEADVYDTARETARHCQRLANGEIAKVYNLEDLFEEDPVLAYMLDLEGDDRPAPPGEDEPAGPMVREDAEADGERSDETSAPIPLDPELLQKFLEQNPDVKIMRSEGELDPSGLFVAGLQGGSGEKHETEKTGRAPDLVMAGPRGSRSASGVFLHDEWDYKIEDYRQSWCRVHELGLDGDGGHFFRAALQSYAEILPEVRRQFQRVKPEGYRIIRGLLDGEDFDLNQVVLARADLRARIDPSPKLYTARQREDRDVATLFLLDMSASTDEEADPQPRPASGFDEDDEWSFELKPAPPKGRRIIDIQKQALSIMAQALEEIGDLYAIYGFSGHGRDRVEFYDVKSFDEPLSVAVRGRIGGIEPQRSTRMGAAIRQAIAKLRGQPSRAKHLILLSDGFPQDFDYGDDRRSNVYGLKDTTMALKEAAKAGITSFCITVDRAGHDYLREMCEEKSYMVIDDIHGLPRELPKIYSEATRG